MLNATTHVCLVSAQAAPNLLPALDPDLKPAEVVLLVSQKMRAQAQSLQSVLAKRGIAVSQLQLPDEHDFEGLKCVLTGLALDRADSRIALNVTGGTKLMALAANAVVMGEKGWEVFYVNVDTDEVIMLWPQSSRKPLGWELRLADYLRAYGYEPSVSTKQNRIEESCVRLMRELVLNVGSLEQALGQLNWLAQEAKGRPELQVRLCEPQRESRDLESLLRKFQDAGALSVDGPLVSFSSERHREFAHGGWLEEFVAREVGTAGGELGVRDHAHNLTLCGRNGDKYELDAVFMARNRLHVIECKTARMDGPRAAKANDVLFKAAEITRNVGGVGSRAMLASYRALSDNERDLARALGIAVVSGPELNRLKERLKVWVQPC